MSLNKLSNPPGRGWARVDSDVMMRALAISSVVWNHATKSPDGVFGGGMTFLMMLSGFNFARFSLRGGTPTTVRASLRNLAVRIGVPSFLLMLAVFAVLHRFSLGEMLFVSNWWTKDRIAVFPIWYPQVMVQMLLGLWLFFLTPLARRALSRPLAFSLGVFLLGVALRAGMPRYVWNTDYLGNNLPHLFLWNFSLGWVVFLLVANGRSSRARALLAIGCVVLGSAVGWGWQRLDFWWLVVGGVLFVSFRTWRLPQQAARVLGLVSQAAFAIFLLHRPSFSLLEHLLPAYKQGGAAAHFLFGLLFSIAVWVFLTALGRAYRQASLADAPSQPVTASGAALTRA